MNEAHDATWRLGRFEIRPAQRQLLADGVPARVGARAFDILVALIERRDRVVSQSELFDLVWPGAVVELNNLQVHISALRKLLGSGAIATVPGRGYRFSAPLDAADGEAPPSPAPDPLPQALTSFVGREHDLAQLVRLFGSTRLLVLTGAGGCGKSRLSIELTRRLLPLLRDGACLVELAALADPALVPQTVAAALGLAESPGRPATQRVAEHLASRQMVLLIDNAEHVLAACASLADAVLRHCPGVKVLATSRERLGITGELSYRVPSLQVPDAAADQGPLAALARYEAVRLFVERAQLQVPMFTLTALNAAAVARVCRRLDGIPLALELAAARMRSLSIDEVCVRMDQRFELLTGGSRTALPRHQTLQSLIDWSYDLLDVQEQAVLCRLSVFAGGCSLEAAEQVCSGSGVAAQDMLALLTSVADKSLLVAEERAGTTRYRMLESVWHYARGKLQQAGEAGQWQARHAAHFCALAQTAAPALRGAEQRFWLDQLDLEHDNLRSVLAGSLMAGGDVEAGLALAANLFRFWGTRGHAVEGRDWIQRLLALTSEETPRWLHANALSAAGRMAYDLSDYRAARLAHEQALALFRGLDDRAALADSLHNLGSAAFMLAEYATAQAYVEECLSIRREIGNRFSIARSVHNLAGLSAARGDHAAARALYEESVAIDREVGHAHGVAWGLVNLGVVACDLDDFSAGAGHFDEALAIARPLGDRPVVAAALMNRGNVALEQGELAAAAPYYRESLALTQELGDLFGMADLLIGLARLHASCRHPATAGQLFGAAQRLREKLEAPIEPSDRARHERRVSAARAVCGDGARFDQGWQEGRAAPLEELVRGLPALQ